MAIKNKEVLKGELNDEPIIEESEPEVAEESEPEVTFCERGMGTVASCDRLNLRAAADASADILSILNVGTEVLIDDEQSTDEFYSVSTADGLDGFCMRDYISR